MKEMDVLLQPEKLREELVWREGIQAFFWERCTSMTMNTNAERVKSSRNVHGNEGIYEAYVLARERVQRARNDLSSAEATLNVLLKAFAMSPGRTSERDAELLRLRYLRRLPWNDVQTILRYKGYPASLRTITNWHLVAVRRLKAFQKKGG